MVMLTLKSVEPLARALETGPTDYEKQLQQVSQFALSYLAALPARPAWEKGGDPRKLRGRLPLRPRPLAEVLELFGEAVAGNGVNAASGRFMGYIPGGGLPEAALGDFLAAITN